MKIAISSTGNNLDSNLDPRFGRCAYFLIVDPADMDYEVFNNQGAAQSRGAGIKAVNFLAGQNVGAVITGHASLNVFKTLASAGIEIFEEQQGTIKEVVARYKSGGLKPATQSAVNAYFETGVGVRCGDPGGKGKVSGGRGMRHCGGGC